MAGEALVAVAAGGVDVAKADSVTTGFATVV